MAPSHYRIRDANIQVRPDLGGLIAPDGQEIYLRPKAFQTLLFLLEQRHRVVTKDEIVARVWPDTAVTDDGLVQCIVEIRRLLGDDARQGRFVRTLPKSGYRFVGDVDVITPGARDLEPEAKSDVPSERVADVPARTRFSARTLMLAAAAVAVTIAAGAYLGQDRGTAGALAADDLANTEPQRSRVAVMFLENESRTPELDWLREGLPDMLVTGLSRSRELAVVDRQQLELLLDRAGHTPNESVAFAEAVTVAQRANLDHIIVGGFAKLGNTIRIDLRLHDKTGRLVRTEALTIDTPGDLLKQVDLLSWRLAQQFGETSPVAPAPATMLTNNLEAYRYYSLGVTQANHYHNVEAIDLLTKATELDPEFAMAYGRIGYAYGVTGAQIERARPYLTKAYQLAHRLSERDRLQVEAWNAIVHLDYAQASRPLAELIRRYPLEVEPYVRLGMILAGELKFDEAVRTLQQGLAADPESTDLWNRIGGVYGESGRYEEAIAAHQKYVALQPEEANAYDSLGGSFYIAGRHAEAIQALERARQLNPDFEVVWVHLGNTYVHMGQYAKAEQAYRKYLASAKADNERRRGYTALAVLAQRRGRLKEAVSLMEQSRPVLPFGLDVPIRIEAGEPLDRIEASLREPVDTPNRGSRLGNRVLLHAKGMLALRRGNAAEAIAHFQAALRDRGVLWQADWLEDGLANAYLMLGRFEDASAEYQRLIQRHPRYPLAHYRLAQAFEGMGRADLAKRAYEEFLRVWANADPDLREIKDAKAKTRPTS
jgi:tetratricopeptide (TPR) repeat protein/DNA-binding winged helix-turn-helix (wHTH) protein